MMRALWRYRFFVLSSVKNEQKNRFARSTLGGVWMILNPLAQVAIYALVLSHLMKARLGGVNDPYAYAIYLMAGILAWNTFSGILSQSLNLFIAHGNLLKKMAFPRITLPSIVAGTGLLDHFLLFLAMVLVFVLLGHTFSLAMLWLVPLSLVLVAFSIGCGLVLGVLNVFIRDVGQVVPILLQLLFWLTPIVYPVTVIPERYRYLLTLNPLFSIVTAYHQVLVYGGAPPLKGLVVFCALSCLLLLLGLFLFRRAGEEMVDVL